MAVGQLFCVVLGYTPGLQTAFLKIHDPETRTNVGVGIGVIIDVN
jgi:hypothetical protein